MASMFDNINPGFLNWASAAFNAFGTARQGMQQQALANYQADVAAADANTAREIGLVQADRVRTAAKYAKGSARAAYGASGVDVNSGSSADVQQRLTAGSELDAWQAILSGQRAYNSGMNTAAALRAAGANAAASGWAGASKSLLSGIGSGIKDGWKYRVPKEQEPAPVEDRSVKLS